MDVQEQQSIGVNNSSQQPIIINPTNEDNKLLEDENKLSEDENEKKVHHLFM